MGLGERLKFMRHKRGMSQTELAAEAGCAQSLVAKIERGGASRSKYTIAFARVLKVSPNWLESDEDDNSRYMVRDDLGEYVTDRWAADAIERLRGQVKKRVLELLYYLESGNLSEGDLEALWPTIEHMATNGKNEGKPAHDQTDEEARQQSKQ